MSYTFRVSAHGKSVNFLCPVDKEELGRQLNRPQVVIEQTGFTADECAPMASIVEAIRGWVDKMEGEHQHRFAHYSPGTGRGRRTIPRRRKH